MKKVDLRSMKNPSRQQLDELAKNVDPNTLRQVQDAVTQYQGKSESDLVEELTRLAVTERAAGKLNNERLEEISRMVAPMLEPSQQQRMKEIMQHLKDNT